MKRTAVAIWILFACFSVVVTAQEKTVVAQEKGRDGKTDLDQVKPRTLTGMVTDKRGNALPGAVVQIENASTLAVRSYITGKDGHYHFAQLSDEVDFTVKAHYRNYWSETKTLSKFDASIHPVVNLLIPID